MNTMWSLLYIVVAGSPSNNAFPNFVGTSAIVTDSSAKSIGTTSGGYTDHALSSETFVLSDYTSFAITFDCTGNGNQYLGFVYSSTTWNGHSPENNLNYAFNCAGNYQVHVYESGADFWSGYLGQQSSMMQLLYANGVIEYKVGVTLSGGTASGGSTYRSTTISDAGSTFQVGYASFHAIDSGAPPVKFVNVQYTNIVGGPAPSPSPPPVANGIQDPHLTGAHGDKMDFRGRHGALYAILSVPRLTFSLRTENATFIKPGYMPKLVHGSFFTDAYWKVQTRTGDEFVVNTSASNIGFDVVDPMGTPVASKHCVWTEVNRDDMRVLYKQATLVMRVAGWETNVTRKPVYNRLSGPRWRFDLSLRPLNSTGFESRHGNASGVVSPHGILGQTWDVDGIAVDGAQDDYEHSGVEMWTASMAEGGIEGVADEYEIKDKFRHEFRYTRYDTSAFTPPRDVSHLSGVRRKGSVKLSASAVDQTGIGYR